MKKSLGGALAGGIDKVGEHLERWGPLLLLLGFMEKKDDKLVPSVHATKAAAHFMGLGLDDEGIISSIFGQMKINNLEPQAQTILNWLGGLENYEQDRFREVLAKQISEFSEIDPKTGVAHGMAYAVAFLELLAQMSTDEMRKEAVLTLNNIPKHKPLPYILFDFLKGLPTEIKNTKEAAEKDTSILSIEQAVTSWAARQKAEYQKRHPKP